MFIYWEGKTIEFWKEEDNEASYKYINTTDNPKYDTIDSVNKICDLIVEVEEKWSKECVECWGERTSKMFDMDWTNLEEINTCNDCWFWKPDLVYNNNNNE
jgi:hypothetical protein